MERQRVETALARIEAASSRIEAAAARLPAAGEDSGLALRYQQLRETVGTSLRELDVLIESLEQ